jgi:hypothetical protein
MIVDEVNASPAPTMKTAAEEVRRIQDPAVISPSGLRRVALPGRRTIPTAITKLP